MDSISFIISSSVYICLSCYVFSCYYYRLLACSPFCSWFCYLIISLHLLPDSPLPRYAPAGGDHSDGSCILEPPLCDSATSPPEDFRSRSVDLRSRSVDLHHPQSPGLLPSTHSTRSPTHGRSVSVSIVPCSDHQVPYICAEDTMDAFTPSAHILAPPPVTPTTKSRNKLPRTTPPSSRKLLQLLPNISLTRSKSQESQLANRIEEPTPRKWVFNCKH